jgi:hypothetical protein
MSSLEKDEGDLTIDPFSIEDWKTVFATADKEQAKVMSENLVLRTNTALCLPSLDSPAGEDVKIGAKLKRKERKDDHTSEANSSLDLMKTKKTRLSLIRDQPNNVVAMVEITRVIAQKKASGSTTVATS